MLHSVAIIAVAAIVTLIIRAVPFVAFGGKREVPETVTYLGKVLPPAIMVILVIYCVKGINLFTGETAFPITALPAEDTGITETVDIAGNLCCAADVLAKNFTGPALAVGDLVAVGNTGAYARTLSPLLFSSHDVPAEFLIRKTWQPNGLPCFLISPV